MKYGICMLISKRLRNYYDGNQTLKSMKELKKQLNGISIMVNWGEANGDL